MGQMTLSLMVISLTILGSLCTVESRSRARIYIEAQCKTTLYFDLCVETLLSYANKHKLPSPQKLAQISLSTCLAKMRSTKAYVDIVAKQLKKMKTPTKTPTKAPTKAPTKTPTKAYVEMVANQIKTTKIPTKTPGEYQASEACLRQINNGVDKISSYVKKLQKMGKDAVGKFSWDESSEQSLVSVAVTEATTCIDGILNNEIGSKEKNMIKARFLNVKQLSSNSIALFTRLKQRQHASSAIKTP
ncbi:hypothetical protein QVD17_38979 [Tagetes erecta]|uniref:Pectinesterase inhibitor domain-containing protein n=1 Tax=Tagetes erecta TaxID=13708 RepID=A0AAD8JT61_TARER|nr:hypothetical protein QVD17_38979 [Tagetes erecta]